MKKLEFFQAQVEREDPQVFRATVLDVRNYGLLIELPDVLLTGLIHISSLSDDFYVFDGARRRLIGRQSKRDSRRRRRAAGRRRADRHLQTPGRFRDRERATSRGCAATAPVARELAQDSLHRKFASILTGRTV